jgi:hypothetical protein
MPTRGAHRKQVRPRCVRSQQLLTQNVRSSWPQALKELVIGASGFLGAHVTRLLVATGADDRREDGYHELTTVFHVVSFLDEVTLGNAGALTLSAEGADPTDECILAWKAAALMAHRDTRVGPEPDTMPANEPASTPVRRAPRQCRVQATAAAYISLPPSGASCWGSPAARVAKHRTGFIQPRQTPDSPQPVKLAERPREWIAQ